MKLLTLLYSFYGRIGRGSYWLGVAIILAVCVLLWLSASLTAPSGSAPEIYTQAISLFLFMLLLLVPVWAALGTKRLHDRGKRGWWLLAFYPLPVLLFWFASARQEPIVPLMILSGMLLLWGVIELGFLPGTPGENAYGPNPSTGLTGQDGKTTLPGA
ncbi:DUF805 domain-containing protein [Terrihabitans soli]|uniref:DUF805 domain-containing protein n=1 Tax=Terrihabitans soli TaxID=708113 RepID=A0A6S6QY72_9HYPH|nr:DUF805 domain-containing protein [Terrihabitans soli]BCJ92000.1 DUF805 domain-containing protein [Terrihabitans soli]